MRYAAGMRTIVWVLASLMIAAGQAQAPAGVDAPTAVYRDAGAGVSFRYPAEFLSRPAMAAAMQSGFASSAAADPDRASEARCLGIPLLAVKGTGAPGTDEFGMIVMMRMDHGCAGEESGEKYLGGDAQQLMRVLGQFGVASTEDALKYKLAGHAAGVREGLGAGQEAGRREDDACGVGVHAAGDGDAVLADPGYEPQGHARPGGVGDHV